MNIYGTPEYRALRQPGLESERVNPITILAKPDEISSRYNLVYDDSTIMDPAAVRTNDDNYVLDPECSAKGVPYTYCLGYRWRSVPSPLFPRCFDHNDTLDSMAGCYYTNGTQDEKCMQIAYTQTAFIGLCGTDHADDPHCGTFIEIHMRHGSPYQSETDIISSVKLQTRNVSGYYTTVIPLTWMGDPLRVLCAYYEDYFRVGSIVYVLPVAPRCCCPPAYDGSVREGSFFCPIGAGGSQRAHLATYANTTKQKLARDSLSVSYPWCTTGLDKPDV